MALSPLRLARLDKGWTLFKLAESGQFSTGRLSMIERSLIRATPEEWQRLADALEVPLDKLVGHSEQQEVA